jgi:hypothetical protein
MIGYNQEFISLLGRSVSVGHKSKTRTEDCFLKTYRFKQTSIVILEHINLKQLKFWSL